MSADNWRVCPKCHRAACDERARVRERADRAYGKVGQDEWLKLLQAAQQPIDLKPTLREDYQIGIETDGNFYVHYRGECSRCDFVLNFKHEKKVETRA